MQIVQWCKVDLFLRGNADFGEGFERLGAEFSIVVQDVDLCVQLAVEVELFRKTRHTSTFCAP